VAGCWRLLAAADAAASSPSEPQLAAASSSQLELAAADAAGGGSGCWLLHQRMQSLRVNFLVPVLVRLRKKSTKGMLRNQTCKRLLNNRFV